jgi:hypothetical protein
LRFSRCTGDQSGWYFEAKLFGRLQVDHPFKARLLKVWHVAGIRSTQYLNDLHYLPAKGRVDVGRVSHKSPLPLLDHEKGKWQESAEFSPIEWTAL